jgi:hypothetical protein
MWQGTCFADHKITNNNMNPTRANHAPLPHIVCTVRCGAFLKNLKPMTKLVLIGILILHCSCDFFKIDKCLDQGGSWNYETRECEFSELDFNSNISELELNGTMWYRAGYRGFSGDSLVFTSDNDVRYYMGELSWTFDSKYKMKNDTLIIKTVSAAFEVDDITGLDPDLVQKYVVKEKSLSLVYQANYRKDKWVKVSEVQIGNSIDFQRLN